MEEPSKFASFSPTIRRVISRRVLLAALMAIVCVLLVNILALRNPAKFALAQSADHSLSPLTKKVLGSLTNDVRVVALFDTQSDLFEPVRNLLVEYERVSSRVKLELVDLARDPARAEAVQQELRSPANAPGNRVLFAVNERVKAVNDSELSILDFSEFMEKREARRTRETARETDRRATDGPTRERRTDARETALGPPASPRAEALHARGHADIALY